VECFSMLGAGLLVRRHRSPLRIRLPQVVQIRPEPTNKRSKVKPMSSEGQVSASLLFEAKSADKGHRICPCLTDLMFCKTAFLQGAVRRRTLPHLLCLNLGRSADQSGGTPLCEHLHFRIWRYDRLCGDRSGFQA
jgi:hypothetical protein